MADNTTFQTTLASPPSGFVVATDDVGGVHFQKVKLDIGGDGASVILSSSNPLPVSDAGGSLTVDGTVAVSGLPSGSLAAITAITADYDSGGGSQDMLLVGVALPGSGGAVAGGTFTNPIRTDPTGTTTQPVSDGGGSITVDGSVTVGSALPSGTNNIGDVDIASIAAGDNVIGRAKITDGTTVADVFDYTNSNPLAVRLSDTNGDYVGADKGSATIAVNQVSVAATATQIVASRTGRRSVTVVMHGSTNIFIGPTSGVTTSNGLLLIGTAGAAVTFEYTGALYGIAATGSVTVSYVEEY